MAPDAETAPHKRLSQWLAGQHRQGMRVIGINGAQGSGKSTLAAQLADDLDKVYGLQTVVLGLDDLYLPQAERQTLARNVHPLLATRGVPGTHDVALGERVVDSLLRLHHGKTLAVPKFLKLADDRAPRNQWPEITSPPDILLFEGWCVGTPPQTATVLTTPINTLEANEDVDGRWRRWVNKQLCEHYASLFARIERLIFLAAPSFDCVASWRLQQEATNAVAETGFTMSSGQIRRFVAHYERLTRHALAVLPETADAVLQLDAQRKIQSLTLNNSAGSA